MGNETISARNLRSLLILMVLCGSLVNGAFTVAQDTWIAVIIMGMMYLPAILIYCRICALFPEKNLYDIITELFGNAGGFILILAMSLYTLVVTALQLRNFTEFTVVIALQETPPIPIMIVLLLPVLYLAKQGSAVLGRWSFIVCALIIFNVLFTIVLALNIIDFSHIFPVMDHSLGDILSNSHTLGSIAVGETVMAMAVLGDRKKGEGIYRIFIPGILLGIGLFALVIVRNILILGPDLEQSAKFSTYMAVRIINLGTFLERIESSISFVYILMGSTKMALFLMAASMGIAKLLRVQNYKKLVVPTGLLVLAVCSFVFQNAFEMFDLAWVYRYYALPFQVLIPILIWIAAEIKTRRKAASAGGLPAS